ncbi:MAG: hypothetical protein ABEI52_03675, partial [Halobacteriaceae archaeon]
AILLAVLSVIAITLAWARDHPSRIRRYLTPRALRIGAIVGLVHLIVAVHLRGHVFDLPWGVRSFFSLVLLAWMLLGAFLEGAIPAILFVRERLVFPALIVGACFAWATIETWQYVQMLRETNVAMAAAITTFTFYLVAWFIVVALAVCGGLAERCVKEGWPWTWSPE